LFQHEQVGLITGVPPDPEVQRQTQEVLVFVGLAEDLVDPCCECPVAFVEVETYILGLTPFAFYYIELVVGEYAL